MTDEELKSLLKTQNLDIKDLAKLAKFLKSDKASTVTEEIKETKNSTKPVIGFKAEFNYPDFTITKTTAKTIKQLVFMVSQNSYFIRSITDSKIPVETLDEENYANFTSGMEDIEVQDFWLKTIKSGKRYYYSLQEYLKNTADRDFIKCGLCKQPDFVFNYDSYYSYSRLNNLNENIKYCKELMPLIKEFYNVDKILKIMEHSPNTVKDLINTFGIQNTRDFLKESLISLIDLTDIADPDGRYSYRWERDPNYHNSWRPVECVDYNRFKEYCLYESVRLGYRNNFKQFTRTWIDDIKMQTKIYGSPKEKYPHNLQVHHDQISDKYDLFKEVIDEQNFAKNSLIAKKYEYTMKDGDYTFIAPNVKEDFIDEAHQQANCLASYVEKFANGEDIIMFMRNKKTAEQSEVTIEVVNGEIIQAYQASNRSINTQQKEGILEWCQKFELTLSRNVTREG